MRKEKKEIVEVDERRNLKLELDQLNRRMKVGLLCAFTVREVRWKPWHEIIQSDSRKKSTLILNVMKQGKEY